MLMVALPLDQAQFIHRAFTLLKVWSKTIQFRKRRQPGRATILIIASRLDKKKFYLLLDMLAIIKTGKDILKKFFGSKKPDY